MDAVSVVVVITGIAFILCVLWFFFGPRTRVLATEDPTGTQVIKITVKGGYSPDVVVVRKDQPVRLDFYRDEKNSCTDRIVFGDFGISRDLPAYKTTRIEFTPNKAGDFEFTCGMNMMRGRLIVTAK